MVMMMMMMMMMISVLVVAVVVALSKRRVVRENTVSIPTDFRSFVWLCEEGYNLSCTKIGPMKEAHRVGNYPTSIALFVEYLVVVVVVVALAVAVNNVVFLL